MHLFATSDKARYAEGKQLNEWIKQYLQGVNDKDVVIIGDVNTKSMGAKDSGNSVTMTNLEKNGVLTCVSKNHPEYTTATTRERYDHALLTKALFQGEYVRGSWDVRREAVSAALSDYKQTISNHVPVVLRISDDGDPDHELPGDYGK